MAETALETVINRNNFYRDNYRRMIVVLFLLVFVIIGLLGVSYYVVSHPTKPAYFATTNEGRITPLYALNQPIISQSEILQWSIRAVVASYSFNFVEYERQFQQAAIFFSPQGWDYFMNALRSSRNLETVIRKKLVATAVPTGSAIIVNRGVINSRYTWKIRVPVLVTYQSASTRFTQALVVTMIIQRVLFVNDPKGIAIEQFVASVSGSGA
jgi:intracellular multiplication protein IcmL